MQNTAVKQTHPVDARPPLMQLFTLGLQHVLVMYAGAVAVPLIIGGALNLDKATIAFLISADLFCCGVVTLIQCIGFGRFGIRLPVIMAVTFAAVGPMVSIGMNPDMGLQGIFGATIAAGAISLLFVPLIGKVMRFFPPLVTGIVITSIGLSIIGVGINWAAGGVGSPDYGAPRYLLTSLAVLIFILLITRYVRGFIANIAVLLGMAFGFVIALFMGEVSLQGIGDMAWFALILPFHFGPPKFELWSIVTLTVVMLITFIESMGMFLALGEIVERPVDRKALEKGLNVDALGTVIGGFFNTFPHTSFSQNVGLVGITGVRSRWVGVMAGVILVVLGLVPKISLLVASIPTFVLGGAGIVMFGMVLATGIRILSQVDYAQQRHNTFIVAISLGMALIPTVAPKFFSQLPDSLEPVLHSGILLASFSAVLLNLYFNGLKQPATQAQT
ncbi:nucleobase:cation symporter-2 family protein [Paenalcaligenes suwonensis]|uniref:nucleobase:cation symporter-2 family protein n=1 Tax=Paenalcaligenes suwonensis TaxID=1202713 RepID=UPI00140906F1|nr:nucleobase:cation symporter-2 family protein [Paenalcaligenes suwonensis]NHC62723.1 purine permease [Paenalcaligenes suwonensis]